MATQKQKPESLTYGDRFQSDDKFFQLYQKAVELGTWDPAKVIKQAPVEEDKAAWEEMSMNDMLNWSGIIGGFLDGEHEVAQDATKLVQMVDSPYVDNSTSKEAFFTTLQFEETKHTQFVSWYADNIVPDEVLPHTGKGVRQGLTRVLPSDVGLLDLFDEQRDALNTAVYSREPQDIARAAAIYNLHVEGLFARGAFTRMKQLQSEETGITLPTWTSTFEFISTDEGRHITAGLQLVKELVEKEKAGDPDYKGVGKTVWNRVDQDVERLAMTALDEAHMVAGMEGRHDDDEYIDKLIEQRVEGYIRYANDMYRRRVDLPEYDEDELRDSVNTALEHQKEEFAETGGLLNQVAEKRDEIQELLELEQEQAAGD